MGANCPGTVLLSTLFGEPVIRIATISFALLASVGSGVARAQSLVVVGEAGVDPARVDAAAAALRERDQRVISLLPGPDAVAAAARVTDAARAAVEAGLEDAKARYIALDLDVAIANLEKIEAEEAADLLGDSRGVAALSELNLWLGNLLVAARRLPEAEERFVQALALRPDLDIDRASFPPEVTRVFDQVKRRPTARIGSLTVESRPDGAAVLVDGGRRRGTTPVTVAAPGGWHYVGLQLPGFQPWAQRVELVAGEVKPLPVALTPAAEERVSADIALLMSERYPTDPGGAVVQIARAARPLSADARLGPPQMAGAAPIDVVVVGAASVTRYRGDGKQVAVASGGDVAAATASLFAAPTPPGHRKSRPMYKRWWFWTAVGGAVATSAVLIYAVTEDDTLRGRFGAP